MQRTDGTREAGCEETSAEVVTGNPDDDWVAEGGNGGTEGGGGAGFAASRGAMDAHRQNAEAGSVEPVVGEGDAQRVLKGQVAQTWDYTG